jgi:VanZ family protein
MSECEPTRIPDRSPVVIRAVWRWLPQIGLLAGAAAVVLITVLSLWPAEKPIPPNPFSISKFYHMVAYAGLAFPVIATGPHRWIWLVPLAIAYGGALELIQPHFNRTAEFLDAVANAVGVGIGVWLGRKVHRHLMAFGNRAALTWPRRYGAE